MKTHTLGFPRIGIKRELKKAQEKFWKDEITQNELLTEGKIMRLRHWMQQRDAGIDIIPVGDFSFYDHMLDMTIDLGAIPERFAETGYGGMPRYFSLPRGAEGVAAMEMTKWFDTNYHYIVPEFYPDMEFIGSSTRLHMYLKEALNEKITPKIVIPGPLTFMELGKEMVEGFSRWDLFDDLLDAYIDILKPLTEDCEYFQFDEPVLVKELPGYMRARFKNAYEKIRETLSGKTIILATYFGALQENLDLAISLPVDVLHVDLVRAPEQLETCLTKIPESMQLSLGIVDGRNIWKVRADKALSLINKAKDKLGEEKIWIAPSCSLLHSPIDLNSEEKLDPIIKDWMAFALQKCDELTHLANAGKGKDETKWLEANAASWQNRKSDPRVTNLPIRQRCDKVIESDYNRKSKFAERKTAQKSVLNLPPLPTTTIGSFPQTKAIRSTRRQFKNGNITNAEYTEIMHDEIKMVVEKQETLGLDMLVHGEPERNDMVEYFGEQLDGFCFTQNGWVQSYGSRCVKPPVIFGDVARPNPMTINWIKYAQSLTEKPMKGMLTGPVTILCWSFVRDDQSRADTCKQIALAVRDEVCDLEKAGIKVIQIDEAALREGVPLRRDEWAMYLKWAVDCFRLCSAGVEDSTQIHTHMCYSEFNEIADSIAAMDADVISIEASRSKMELLQAFESFEYPNDIGPGVYDIHSPRIPSKEEMVDLLKKALEVIPADKLWVNPDCGLKTRTWDECYPSLENMVAAAKEVRQQL